MKILQVMAGAAHGGAETAFVDMCVAMKESGQDVVAVTRSNPVRVPALREAGVPVHILPFGGAVDLYTPWALTRIVAQEKPRIVQSWMARAAQKIRKSKTGSYVTVSRLGGYYKLKNFQNTDYFTVIAPDIGRHLIEGGVVEDRIRFIPNFAEMEKVVTPMRKADFDTPEEAPVLLTLARLHRSKALDIVIAALVEIPGAYLWLAGEGPERAALETLAMEKGVADRVRFLGWRTDRAALLQAADICVFASRFEPFGTVFAQAWAAGTPVIVSDADGPRQFCRDGEDCLMVPRDDTAALAGAVRRVLEDSALAAKIVDAGIKRYRATFTKDASVDAYLDYYREILERDGISS